MKRSILQLFLTTALLILAACTPGGTTNPPATSNPASSGKIKVENWPAQTGKIRFQFNPGSGNPFITEAAIAAYGTGEYTMPAVTANIGFPKDTLASPGCANTIIGSPVDAQMSRPSIFYAYPGTVTSPSGNIFVSSAQPSSNFAFPVGFKFAQHVYADKDVTISGALTCATGPNYSSNASLKAGWNYLILEIKTVTASGQPASIDITASTTEPSGFKWYYVGNPAP